VVDWCTIVCVFKIFVVSGLYYDDTCIEEKDFGTDAVGAVAINTFLVALAVTFFFIPMGYELVHTDIIIIILNNIFLYNIKQS